MKKSTRNLLIAGGILLGGGLLLAGGGTPSVREQVLQEMLRILKLTGYPPPTTEQIKFARSQLLLVSDSTLADLLVCLRKVQTDSRAEFEANCSAEALAVFEELVG